MNLASLKTSTKLWGLTVILCFVLWAWVLVIYTNDLKKIDNVIFIVAKEDQREVKKEERIETSKLEAPVPVPAPPLVKGELERKYQIALEEIEAFAKKYVTEDAYNSPKAVVIAATWRTGSTFFAEAFSAHPWVYYHYEPLTGIRVTQDLVQAGSVIEALSSCSYFRAPEYIETVRADRGLLLRNNKIQEACEYLDTGCFNPDFLSKACDAFPVQLLKTVRMPLNGLESFLLSPNFHVIFLVRDPRAIFASRLKLKWCTEDELCANPDVLCNSLKTDLNAYEKFRKRYPDQVRLVRYEDLAKEPLKVMQKTFEDLEIKWDRKVERYLREHTNAELDKPWTTYRISRLRVNAWRSSLPADMIAYIQEVCDDFIRELNYTRIDTSLCGEFC